VSDVLAKYDAVAESYSDHDYADPARYYARRARLLVELEPSLARGRTVLDFACGDGRFGVELLARGIDYRGVDGSTRMVEVARRVLGDRVAHGTFDHVPSGPVDATTVFRSMYLVPDRRAFLTRVHGFTRSKLVFDFDPRRFAVHDVVADVVAAGWTDVRLRPFLTPQRASLPAPVQHALWRLEPLPGARALTRVRFPLLVSATA